MHRPFETPVYAVFSYKYQIVREDDRENLSEGTFEFEVTRLDRCSGCGDLIEPGRHGMEFYDNERCSCWDEDEGETEPERVPVECIVCTHCRYHEWVPVADFPQHLDQHLSE